MESMLPAELLDAQGNVVPTSSILGGVVALYFSAHWCPPCRGFTPVLSQWYADFTKNNPDKKLNIVFVSSDRSEQDFKDYHKEMTFHALPYAEREKKSELSAKFGVRGIPTLIFLDSDGNVLTKDGRSLVSSDPQGKDYPWAPKKFSEAVAGSFINNKGETFDWESLKGKYVSFYFSAHWCPPCRGFTPKLVDTYNAVKAAGKPWEVIFVSGDRSDDQFEEYFATMPWLSLPFEDARGDWLNSHFEVDGIPTLVLVSPEGKLITTELRGSIEEDPTGADFPWPKKAINTLRGAVGAINDQPTLVVLTDGTPGMVADARAALTPAAEEELKRGENARIQFAVSGADEADQEIRGRLLDLLSKTDASFPLAVLFNVPAQTRYDLPASELTVDGVNGVVSRFANKTLEFQALRE